MRIAIQSSKVDLLISLRGCSMACSILFDFQSSFSSRHASACSHVYSAHLLAGELVGDQSVSSAVISLREESVERSLLVGPGVGPSAEEGLALARD